jgi:hypothetical protein
MLGGSNHAFVIREKKINANIGIGIGVIIQPSRFILVHKGIVSADVGQLIWLIGVLCFIWGCMNYAEGKGSSKWFGLLGILSLIGLLALFFLPDQHKDGK